MSAVCSLGRIRIRISGRDLRLLMVPGLLAVLAGCGRDDARALGTLEWDRITVPAPAAEVIASIMVVAITRFRKRLD